MKSRYIDLTSKVFGRLTVTGIDVERVSKRPFWICKCSCGNIKSISGASLRGGDSNSCGCLAKELTVIRSQTHGLSKTKTYKTWISMWARCTDEAQDNYPNYGGRGISVDERWKSFEAFLKDMGERPEGLSIDRIDVNGNYCKANCKWSDNKEQSNNRRSTKIITFKNETMTQLQWAEKLGISVTTLHTRLKNNWPLEKALSTINYRKKYD
jgi:hypothetical protein